MAYIQAELNKEEDELLRRAARLENRSKKQQLKVSALAHARMIINDSEAVEKDPTGIAARAAGKDVTQGKGGAV